MVMIMVIADLKIREGNVELVAEVVEKGDVREFEKFGKAGTVCTAKLKDDSGEISLTLWNEDIDKVNVGDKIQIKNGYVSEWQGEPQLTTGKFGSMEVLEKGSGEQKAEAPAKEEKKPDEPEEESTEEPEVKEETVE